MAPDAGYPNAEEIWLGDHVQFAPCVPRHQLGLYEPRPCPYISLDEENALPAQLAFLLAQEPLVPLFDALFQAAYGDADADERTAVINRVATAIVSPNIRDRLFPKPQPLALAQKKR